MGDSRYASIVSEATRHGLAVRGAFHPDTPDRDLAVPGAVATGTFVMLGFTGRREWPVFANSAEARDGAPDPLDRWSRRVIGSLAREFGALDVYPSSEPRLPFQRLAARCESVYPSPLGLLIHPTAGLWHAYRGALVLGERIELPPTRPRANPCSTCLPQPCRTACPVGAFGAIGFDVTACTDHVLSAAGRDCREQGCRARRACPVAAEFRYGDAQARFHMEAFLRAVRG